MTDETRPIERVLDQHGHELTESDVLREVARHFVVATKGRPHYELFFPWLHQREQHDLLHAIMATFGKATEGQDHEAAAQKFYGRLVEATYTAQREYQDAQSRCSGCGEPIDPDRGEERA